MKLKNVEDIYPLSPMQEAMLFHLTTHSSSTSTLQQNERDVLFNQVCIEITGELHVDKFQLAWQTLVNNHPALRTAFVWEGLKKPQQIVRKTLTLPYTFIDLCNLDDDQQDTHFREICDQDKREPFKAQHAPLMRIQLVKFAESKFRFIWSSHHLVMDRWCIGVLFEQLWRMYQNKEDSFAPITGFKAYIAWLKRQNVQQAQYFWRTYLTGFTKVTPVTQKGTSPANSLAKARLSPSQSDSLRHFCRKNRITPATTVNAAWALTLCRHGLGSDIVFGNVVSGRPAALADVENIVGSFVSNIPVRFQLAGHYPVIDWLVGLHKQGLKRSSFEYLSANQIQDLSEIGSYQQLFDCIVLWLEKTELDGPEDLSLKPISADSATSYPLTLSVEEVDGELVISFQLAVDYESFAPLDELADTLCETLLQLSNCASDTVLEDLYPQLKGQQGSLAMEHEEVEFESVTHSQPNQGKTNKGREEVDIEEIQAFLIEEWKHILNLTEIQLDDDFFALGGNSLKATQLLKRVELAERKSIPILALFQARTVRQMAQVIIEQDWPISPEITTPINTQGDKLPLFCIASPEVNTLGYANLSHWLSPQQPLYVLQSPPDTDNVRQLHAKELPDMAKAYVDAMMKVQPRGPYKILGMCTGSQIAIEMVRQLEQAEGDVAFLGVVNTWAFYTVTWRYYIEKVRLRLKYYSKRISSIGVEEFKQILSKKVAHLLGKPLSSTSGQVLEGSAPPVETVSYQHTPTSTQASYDDYSLIDDVGWTHLKPDLANISTPVTVFRLKTQPYWRIIDTSLGWNKLANEVKVVDLKGDIHLAILREPFIEDIANKLTVCLDDNIGR